VGHPVLVAAGDTLIVVGMPRLLIDDGSGRRIAREGDAAFGLGRVQAPCFP
jgi:hypothetical protein